MCAGSFPLEWDELPPLFPGLQAPSRWLPLLQRHQALVSEAAPHTRVTTVAPPDAVQRQYAESLELLSVAMDAYGALPSRIADVGSGGGFPGLVMACVLPGTQFALVEPLRKRARLLEDTAAALGLENVSVYAQRAEEAGRGPLRDACDMVTARAVAALPELLEYTAPLARPGGLIALPKGSQGEFELAAAERAIALLACSNPRWCPMRNAVSEHVRVLLIDRSGPTVERYPRRPGLPGKRPL